MLRLFLSSIISLIDAIEDETNIPLGEIILYVIGLLILLAMIDIIVATL